MSSVKSRLALAGAKYLVTHPRGRVTRLVVGFAVRRASKKIVTAVHTDAIPATRGSRLVTVVGIVAVAGGIVLIVRRAARPERTGTPTVPPPYAPFPSADGAPPETRDAPPSTPAMSPIGAAAAEIGADDDALVGRVRETVFGGTPPVGVTVEAQAGVVTLRGAVADVDSELRFVRNAESIEGVKAVQSELQTTAGAEPDASAP